MAKEFYDFIFKLKKKDKIKSELPPKSTSKAVCQRCWSKGKIQKDCLDCKGTGKREP